MKAKLELVLGFLGSGKSSFINAYIESEICEGEKLLIILLEKGDTIINQGINRKVIYLEDLKYLKEIIIRELGINTFNRIIIEYNGTSSLNIIGDICKDKSIKKIIDFYGGYFTCDTREILTHIKNLGEIIVPFIQGSKLIILNNFNLVSMEKGDKIINLVKEININAPIITIPLINHTKMVIEDNKYFKRNLFVKNLKSLIKVKINDKMG